jgi:hypothetical protein
MMKITIKQYVAQNLCSAPIEQAESFMEDLSDSISRFQNKGLIVEVQFQPTQFRFSALVLAYKNEVTQ